MTVVGSSSRPPTDPDLRGLVGTVILLIVALGLGVLVFSLVRSGDDPAVDAVNRAILEDAFHPDWVEMAMAVGSWLHTEYVVRPVRETRP